MNPWNDHAALQLIEQARDDEVVLTTILRQLVDHFGYIDDVAIAPLAKAFSRSNAEVYGVIQYYSDFRDQAPGQHILRICQAESCQAVGSRELTQAVCDHTNTALGQTTDDNILRIEPVYCLGLCANGPAAELDGQPLAELTQPQILGKLQALRR